MVTTGGTFFKVFKISSLMIHHGYAFYLLCNGWLKNSIGAVGIAFRRCIGISHCFIFNHSAVRSNIILAVLEVLVKRQGNERIFLYFLSINPPGFPFFF